MSANLWHWRMVAAAVLVSTLGIACVPPEATPTTAPTAAETSTATATAGTAPVGTPTVPFRPAATPIETPRSPSTPTDAATSVAQRPTTLTLSVNVSQKQVAVGQTASIALTLWNAKTGLSGYDLTMNLDPGSPAEITRVRLPDFGLTQVSELPASSVRIQAADLNNKVQPGGQEQLLATLEVRGNAAGSATMVVKLTAMDDETGSPLKPEITSATFQVQ